MKYKLLAIICSIYLGGFSQTDSVLFLGNSYTYTNDVPGTFKNLAASAGKSVFTDNYTPGGKQLSQHYSDATTASKINSKQWDYVVLQEQSQMPAINPSTTIYYAQRITLDLIKTNNKCTETVIYMTWAREAGNSWLSDVGWTHEEMATYYEDFYEDIWEYVPGRVSPVGKAFHEATRQGYNVYSGDGSHQNSTGTYLAACVFYATIYKASPIGLSYTTQDAPTTAALQQIAHDVVISDLYEHNIDKVRMSLSATSINQGDQINFLERVWMDPWPTNFDWSFEGAETTTSEDENPSGITYNSVGNFDVTLSITDECGYSESRTLSDTVEVLPSVSVDNIDRSSILIQSISGEGVFQLNDNLHSAEISIYDLLGRSIDFYKDGVNVSINSSAKTGTFIVRTSVNGNNLSEKVYLTGK